MNKCKKKSMTTLANASNKEQTENHRDSEDQKRNTAWIVRKRSINNLEMER